MLQEATDISFSHERTIVAFAVALLHGMVEGRGLSSCWINGKERCNKDGHIRHGNDSVGGSECFQALERAE